MSEEQLLYQSILDVALRGLRIHRKVRAAPHTHARVRAGRPDPRPPGQRWASDSLRPPSGT